MFRRRTPLGLGAKLRALVWPRMGLARVLRYHRHRVVRMPGTARAIAGGFAWGAAMSFTPFVGLHFVLAGLAAWLTRCGIVASAVGTAVGNPWTFPFIWALVYNVGVRILGMDTEGAPALDTLAALFVQLWREVGTWVMAVVGLTARREAGVDGAVFAEALETIFWPMLVGSVPVGIVVWFVFYLPLKRAVEGYQHRRARYLKRRRERAGASGEDVPNS